VRAILDTTRCKAPFLLERVGGLILQFLARKATWSQSHLLEEQIAVESRAGGTVPFIDQRPILIPPAFRHSYDLLFAEALEKVLDGLQDRSRVPGALVEIFTDFLVRWGISFEGLQEHHRAELHEITARTIAVANRASTTGRSAYPGEVVSGRRDISQLRNETLKCVERDLRRMYRTPEDNSFLAEAATPGEQGGEALVQTLHVRPRS
jgi:hypothetical protein